MKEIELLNELQGIELLYRKSADQKARLQELRKTIPDPLLGHYDRLMVRGKKGVALVQHGVCGGCRMRLPSGVYGLLLRDDDIAMCDNCARYLLLVKEPETESPPPPVRKRKTAVRRPKTRVTENATAAAV